MGVSVASTILFVVFTNKAYSQYSSGAIDIIAFAPSVQLQLFTFDTVSVGWYYFWTYFFRIVHRHGFAFYLDSSQNWN